MKQPVSVYLIPILMLGVCCLAYGVFLTRQGFYWDDWTVVYLLRARGLDGLRDLFAYDRPFSLWEYVLTNALAGTDVLRRQVLGLGVRWLVGISYWLFLSALWPKQRTATAWMALLFCVYPLFFQQPVALTYAHPFLAYVLFCFSLFAMVWGVKHPGRGFWIPLAGFFAFVVQLITVEYFVGLEIVRPVVLWYAMQDQGDGAWRRAASVFKKWLPFLSVYVLFVIWRLFFLQLPEDTNAPVVLQQIASSPLTGGITLLENGIRDWIFSLLVTWNRTLQIADISLSDRFLVLSWLAVFAAVGLLAFAMKKWEGGDQSVSEAPCDRGWHFQALWIGGLASAAGMLPFWAGGKFLGGGYYADRVGIPATFGASIFLVALISTLVSSPQARRILLALLVGLAIGSQMRAAKDYAWDWTNQQRFYWQLHWRAPQIDAGTLLISDDSLFRYVTGYSLAAAINTLYEKQPGSTPQDTLPYWFIEANDAAETRPGEVPSFLAGRDIERNMRALSFRGNSRDTLILSYQPPGRCLWLLRPEDRDYILLPERLREILPAANLDLVRQAEETETLPVEIFGSEPQHDWCYFYQKADYARQEKDWDEVLRLWEEAKAAGFKPDDAFERLPFIEAHLARDQVGTAADMSIDAFKRQIELQASICRLWQPENKAEQHSAAWEEAAQRVRARLNCP